jgi:ribosome biogenesis protein BRX1
MAAVYKSLSRKDGKKADDAASTTNGVKKNKQRVLILSSRGVTYRCGSNTHKTPEDE